jgi:hypothetical protein
MLPLFRNACVRGLAVGALLLLFSNVATGGATKVNLVANPSFVSINSIGSVAGASVAPLPRKIPGRPTLSSLTKWLPPLRPGPLRWLSTRARGM